MAKEEILFQDTITVVNEWKSLAKKGKSEKTDHSSQTKAVVGTDASHQTVQITHRAIQTEKENNLSSPTSDKEAQSSQMVDFLGRVESLMSSQLIANAKSSAFQGYYVEWEEEIKDITLTYTLSNDQPMVDAKYITGISWNSTGSTIAAAFACKDHSDWCSHKGQICTWNMSLRNFQQDSPFFHAETSSCLMALAFHPVIPSLIVGGTFTGEIIIWSTLETHDPVIMTSKISDFSHHEPVAQLMWIKSDNVTQIDDYKIVSIGNDGKILEWSLENKLATPIQMTNVHTKCIPRLLKSQSGATPLGIKSIAWTKDNVYEYIIGTETGFILRCSTKRGLKLSKQTKGMEISQNPVVFSYEPHVGACLSISFSSFHRNLFLTSGADGIVRLFHIHSFSPLLTWEPSFGNVVKVQWSRTRPSVFLCALSKGKTLLYDLSVSKITPVAEIKTPSNDQGNVDACFNPGRRETIAVGLSDSTLNIWKLKSNLYEQSADDLEVLNQFSI